MERIKQAIEKARQQNPERATTLSSGTAGTSTSRPPTGELSDLSYQVTRVQKVSSEHLNRHRIVAHKKNANHAWAFDLLRTQVLKVMDENGWRTLAITSPTPEAGKTVVAINLAMSIAQHTTKTALLVDFDLRRPKVGAYLGLTMDKSLNDVLVDALEVQDALVNPDMPRFVVLPTKKPLPHSTEVLSSPRVANLISDLRERYASRIVIFDLPPILNTDDAIAVLAKFDCVLLVVANGMNTKKEIEDSLYHLPQTKLVGTILNKAEANPRSEYY